MPAMAMPVPESCPLLFLTLTRETIPSTRPTTAVIPHEIKPRIPRISEVIAIALVLGGVEGAAKEDGAGVVEIGVEGADGAFAASANSGKADNGRHSVLPSA